MKDSIKLSDLLYYADACLETAYRIGSCADKGDWDPEATKYYEKSDAADTILLDLFFDGNEEEMRKAKNKVLDETGIHGRYEPPGLPWEEKTLKVKEEKTMKVTLEYVPKRATGKDKARINLVCNGKIESFWVDEETGALEEINTIPQLVELEF